MPTRRVIALILAAATLELGLCGESVAAEGKDCSDVVPGVVVVKFKRSYSIPAGIGIQSAAPKLAALANSGVTSLARAFPDVAPLSEAEAASGKIDLSQIHYASIPLDRNPCDVAGQLARLPQVEYAEPKFRNYICDVPNDSDYAAFQQIYFDRMNAAAGWSLQKGTSNVLIATIDGGTNWQHPDLLPNIWINRSEDINHNGRFDQFPAPAGDLNGVDDDNNGFIDDVVGWNFSYSTFNPRGVQTGNANHGTATASIFGAVTNNGRGMAGTSWNCLILPVCAADPSKDDQILYGFQGIQYAASIGARVITCCWSRPGGANRFAQMEQDVITAATQSGALVVAAAGNDRQNNDETPYYPASYEHVLSVGATENTSDALAYFSNYGANVSVYAPGMGIRVALNDGSYGTMQGTSMAGPLVSGLAGLLFAAHPGWTPDQVAEQIRITSDPIDAFNPSHAGSLGHGMVNFARALSETHAGITIVSSEFRTPDGRKFVIPGDTLVLSLVVGNIQSSSADGATFTVTSRDPDIIPVQRSVTIGTLNSNEQTILPDFRFIVTACASQHTVFVELRWVWNTNDSDTHVFSVPAFPADGYWHLDTTLASDYLYEIKAVDSSVAWAAGGKRPSPYSHLVLRTIDGGRTWADATGNLPSPGPGPTGAYADRISVAATDAEHAWIASSSNSTTWQGRIFATTDGGASWSQQTYPDPQAIWMNGIWFLNPDHGFALGDGNDRAVVLETTNGGTIWQHLPFEPGSPGAYGGGSLYSYIGSDEIWITLGFRVWHTTDRGVSWSSGRFDGFVYSLSFRNSVFGLLGGNGFLSRSTNGGEGWTHVSTNVAGSYFLLKYAPGSSSAHLASDHGIYRSEDDGTTWTQVPSEDFVGGPSNLSMASPNVGWLITDKGEILRYRPSGTIGGLDVASHRLPSQFLLEQNYPNPFNPTTTIRYSIPRRSQVSLRVYNLLGQEVVELIQGEYEAGYHEARFDGSGLSSGVYFYRMTAGDYVATMKLLLIR